MRIAFFTETFIPKVDGIVTTLCQTIRQLESKGHEVLIVAPDGGEERFSRSRIARMPGHAFPFYPELRLAFPHASIRATLTDFHPDIIHVADPALLGIAGLYYAGGYAAGALKLPLVISYHTDLPQYLHHYGLGFLEPAIWPAMRARHRRAALNLCTSQAVLQELRSHGILNTAMWPGGVDAELHRPERRSRAMRDRLSQRRDGPVLLYVGRLSAEKEVGRLKTILQGVQQTRPEVNLAIIGDGPERASLERHFAGLPVNFCGFLHGEELAAAYASADIFVMPSRTETLGLVILEAMSAGLPVVGANAGGIPELIESGHNGFLFDDEPAAIQAIQSLLADASLATAIRQTADATVKSHSWEAATDLLLSHYAELLRQSARYATGEVRNPPPGRTRKVLMNATSGVLRRLLP